MTLLERLCPVPPGWQVPWEAIAVDLPWIEQMQACPQDEAFHAEGDVWTHTRLVVEALAGFEAFQNLAAVERQIVFAAALLHDVAKPGCTRHEGGRITSRGHSQRGALLARRWLWEAGAEFHAREQVCALVRHHQAPFYLIDRPDAQRLAFLISQSARCDLLYLLARADGMGRRCADQSDLLHRIDLFREYCVEQGCLHGPRRFASAHSRFQYFRTPGRDPDYVAHDQTRCEVIVMSGLPGAGKDGWLERNRHGLVQVCLDAVREELGVEAVGNQGTVVQVARENARVFLRAGRDFAWNATHLSREIRNQVIDLAAAYDARVRIIYVEANYDVLHMQNRSRRASVPERAIERMLERWEVPDASEAHIVEWWVNGVLADSTESDPA